MEKARSGRFSGILAKAALVLTAALYLWAAASVFARNFYDYDRLRLALCALCALALIVGAWFLTSRFEPFIKRNSRPITAAFLCLMGAVQLVMIFPLRYTPVYDVDAIFGGAAEWAETGAFASYSEYFGMFPNNFGGLVLLRCVFGIAKLLGIKDFFLAASVFNSVLSIATMYLTGSVCAKLTGERGRITAYFLFLISLPFYFIAPAFYTDALSMAFPILILRLYISAREQNKPAKRLLLFLLMGAAAGVGYGIKATAAIMLIAVFIDALLFWGAKRALSIAAAGAAGALLCTLLTQAAVYPHLDRAEEEKVRIPVLHWVMMGSAGNGFYDPDEYDFTKSFADPAERKKAVAERLVARLKSYDAADFASLFTGKLDIDFGDGAYGLSDCLGGPHGEDNFLHSFLLKDGENRGVYKHICTGVVIALYVLLIVSCFIDAFSKGAPPASPAPRLALLGLLIFLLVWEARWRYFSNHIPVFIVSAVLGLDSVTRIFSKMEAKR